MDRLKGLQDLDVDKLKENALTSIRLGVEDFSRSQLSDGDPARALSAVRNLFAGMLLIFKYKILTCVADPKSAASLIFNSPEILPCSDGNGGVDWKPSGKFKRTTIDVGTIKKRFESFGIQTDWDVIDKLQGCRNHLEHLHPDNTLGEVASFVAELFPLLDNFVQNELNDAPANMLGDSWRVMLEHHDFHTSQLKICDQKWSRVDVPIGMRYWQKRSKCRECGSSLLIPDQVALDNKYSFVKNENEFYMICLSCNCRYLAVPVIMHNLKEYHGFYDANPAEGDFATIEKCKECGRDSFDIYEGFCYWCGNSLENVICKGCGIILTQDTQDNDGFCELHY